MRSSIIYYYKADYFVIDINHQGRGEGEGKGGRMGGEEEQWERERGREGEGGEGEERDIYHLCTKNYSETIFVWTVTLQKLRDSVQLTTMSCICTMD